VTITDDLIAFDPTTIAITRHTKVDDEGGFDYTTATLARIDVRLYQFNTRNQREATMPDGERKFISLGVLAPKGSDIVFSHDSYDTFTALGRTYRVVGVRTYDDVNIDECIQADCVAV
jgi:hypothetical protein